MKFMTDKLQILDPLINTKTAPQNVDEFMLLHFLHPIEAFLNGLGAAVCRWTLTVSLHGLSFLNKWWH